MKIVFYQPVVTPWRFDNVVLPLIRATAAGEAHVLIPSLWRNTSITLRQLKAPPNYGRVVARR